MDFIIQFITALSYKLINYFYLSTRSRSQIIKRAGILMLSIFFISTIFIVSWIDFAAINNLKNYTPPIPSQLLDRKGRVISTYFKDKRIVVKINDLPVYLPQAFLAMEDNEFYSHYGINISSIIRALMVNFLSGDIRQGGSTITQQLTKIILTDRSRTYVRKIKEAFISLYLELTFSKDEILNLYLNELYLGHGNYGIEAASHFYFNKSAKEISIGEAAILATLPSAPNYYSPVRNPHGSQQKTLTALLNMVDLNMITLSQATAEYEKLLDYYSTLQLSPTESAFGSREDLAPYFTEYMRQILENELGKENLYSKGYKIYTCLDIDHQNIAQKVLWEQLKELNNQTRAQPFKNYLKFSDEYGDSIKLIRSAFDLPDFKIKKKYLVLKSQLYLYNELLENLEILNMATGLNENIQQLMDDSRKNNPYLLDTIPVQGALIEMDNATGEVTSMVGGLPFNATNQINRAVQMKRQPGSTFKPILYAAAIDQQKITAASLFVDTPNIFLDIDGDFWIPENYSGGFRGFITVREALTYSTNMVSIAIAREVGIKNLIPQMAKELNVKENDIPTNLTVALGSYEVSPLQMTKTFALFPRGGYSIEPTFIKKILDHENKMVKDYSSKSKEPEQIISRATAAIMTDLLKNVVNEGTGKVVRKVGYNGFAAGKTGTTNNFKDAWFVGFNERYTSAVWIGYDQPTKTLGSGQAGGAIAAPVWAKFQFYTQPYRQKEEPYVLEGDEVKITICKSTGKLPTPDCRETITELFISGTEPVSTEETINNNSGSTINNEKSTPEKKHLYEDLY